jgi:hypothetical protein
MEKLSSGCISEQNLNVFLNLPNWIYLIQDLLLTRSNLWIQKDKAGEDNHKNGMEWNRTSRRGGKGDDTKSRLKDGWMAPF